MPDLTSIRRLIGERALDGELAALLWLLLESRTPVVVAGRPGGGRDRVLDALLGLLPEGAPLATVAPDDDFEWLPEAVELGWRRERSGAASRERSGVAGVSREGRVSAVDGVLLVRGLADAADAPEGPGVGGARARIVVRSLALGYGLLATMTGGGLDDALDALDEPAIGTDADERSRLGVVLAMDPGDAGGATGVEGGAGLRVLAAHYVRPVAFDTHGHVQRLPPAVLATWSPGAGRWDHFAWGLMPELAGRLGVRPIELEREQARRASMLAEPVLRGG